MLNEICKELNNWFETGKYFNTTFTISDGQIDLSDLIASGALQTNQYFRIVGSVFNDGVYQYPATDLTDEIFDGAIWPMVVPKEIIDLSTEISNWNAANAEILASPYQSESFGGYSYSKTSGNDGNTLTWKDQFGSRLSKWRKIRCRY